MRSSARRRLGATAPARVEDDSARGEGNLVEINQALARALEVELGRSKELAHRLQAMQRQQKRLMQRASGDDPVQLLSPHSPRKSSPLLANGISPVKLPSPMRLPLPPAPAPVPAPSTQLPLWQRRRQRAQRADSRLRSAGLASKGTLLSTWPRRGRSGSANAALIESSAGTPRADLTPYAPPVPRAATASSLFDTFRSSKRAAAAAVARAAKADSARTDAEPDAPEIERSRSWGVSRGLRAGATMSARPPIGLANEPPVPNSHCLISNSCQMSVRQRLEIEINQNNIQTTVANIGIIVD